MTSNTNLTYKDDELEFGYSPDSFNHIIESIKKDKSIVIKFNPLADKMELDIETGGDRKNLKNVLLAGKRFPNPRQQASVVKECGGL